MYHPYFRGKQYELLTVRECAGILKEASFTPIIEPVKEALGGLDRTLSAIIESGGSAIVIVNPYHGYHSSSGNNITALLRERFFPHNIVPGILLTEDMNVSDVRGLYSDIGLDKVAFIHAGFSQARQLSEEFQQEMPNIKNIFYDDRCGKLYQKHFRGTTRVLLRDGFEKRKNRDHPELEFFSDLHATYDEEGMDGFGDFLMVGDDYTESGGPAYAIAIHLTFIDPEKDDEMHIHHFKSIRQDDPKDPAGKFAEALAKMMDELRKPDCKIVNTSAVTEFEDLDRRRHFPGLGYVKKLSMKHHIETLAHFFKHE